MQGLHSYHDTSRFPTFGRLSHSPKPNAIIPHAQQQALHDALMRRLPTLKFSDDVTVLDWLCEMQAPSDHVGVIVRRETILATFAKHGFLPGVNCDADFRPQVRDNVHRWLVGQALSGLEGPAIHGLIHKFAAEWKKKFLSGAAA